MFEEGAQSEEILSRVAPMPVLSSGLRSRVLTAVVEAQESRRKSRRLISGSLGVFALLSWLSWRNPAGSPPPSQGTAVSVRHVPPSPWSGARLSLLGMSVSEPDGDVLEVEWQLRSRQDYFPRAQPM